MSKKIEGFEVIVEPQRRAREWFRLYRSGKFDEAAAKGAEEQRRIEKAAEAAVRDRLEALLRLQNT